MCSIQAFPPHEECCYCTVLSPLNPILVPAVRSTRSTARAMDRATVVGVSSFFIGVDGSGSRHPPLLLLRSLLNPRSLLLLLLSLRSLHRTPWFRPRFYSNSGSPRTCPPPPSPFHASCCILAFRAIVVETTAGEPGNSEILVKARLSLSLSFSRPSSRKLSIVRGYPPPTPFRTTGKDIF